MNDNNFRNTVFEDPFLFAPVRLPKEGLYGIAGISPTQGYIVSKNKENGEFKAQSFGTKRAFFGSKTKKYHFDSQKCIRKQTSIEKAVKAAAEMAVKKAVEQRREKTTNEAE